MNIEPAMISLMENTTCTSSKMADQNMILSQKKAANLSMFSKNSKQMTSGQNAGNL